MIRHFLVKRLIREDSGAEMVEFAMVAPLLVLFIFGTIYGLLAAAAEITLAHAGSVGVRYATVPIDPVAKIYPSAASVAERVYSATPFFDAEDCSMLMTGAFASNSPLKLSVTCNFPNPAASAVNGARAALLGPGGNGFSEVISMSSTPTGRRE